MKSQPLTELIKNIWYAIIGFNKIVVDAYIQGWNMAELHKAHTSVRIYEKPDDALKNCAVNLNNTLIKSAFVEGFNDCINAQKEVGDTTPLILKKKWLKSNSNKSLSNY